MKTQQTGIHIDNSILDHLKKTDGIIFDCDGVLIDITKSYDLTIAKTVNYVLENFAEINDGITVDSKITCSGGTTFQFGPLGNLKAGSDNQLVITNLPASAHNAG